MHKHLPSKTRAGNKPKRFVKGEELLQQVWGCAAGTKPRTRTLDTHAIRLQHRLGPPFVVTVWGVGYRLIDPWLEW